MQPESAEMVHYEIKKCFDQTGVVEYRFLYNGKKIGTCSSPVTPDSFVHIRFGEVELKSTYNTVHTECPAMVRLIESPVDRTEVKLEYIGEGGYAGTWSANDQGNRPIFST